MAKASLELPDGTQVTVEGTVDEVARLLEVYSHNQRSVRKKSASRKSKTTRNKKTASSISGDPAEEGLDLAELVGLIKQCDEAEAIEQHVLDQSVRVDRVLMPLYVADKYIDMTRQRLSFRSPFLPLRISVHFRNAIVSQWETSRSIVVGRLTDDPRRGTLRVVGPRKAPVGL